jgi:hypothetical protein
MKISPAALAALTLHNAQRQVSGRSDGAWSLLDDIKWGIIGALPVGPEHDFLIAVIHSHTERKKAA